MPLPRPASPRALWADVRAFTSERRPHQWVAASLALLMPLALIVLFIIDGHTNIQPKSEIIFVESWPANRTDAQIKADQKKDQAARDAARKERQKEFQRLDESLNRMGI
ncbi:MAG: hypothetical protein ACJ8ER_16275 [Allosphingosinicella sp.]